MMDDDDDEWLYSAMMMVQPLSSGNLVVFGVCIAVSTDNGLPVQRWILPWLLLLLLPLLQQLPLLERMMLLP